MMTSILAVANCHELLLLAGGNKRPVSVSCISKSKSNKCTSSRAERTRSFLGYPTTTTMSNSNSDEQRQHAGSGRLPCPAPSGLHEQLRTSSLTASTSDQNNKHRQQQQQQQHQQQLRLHHNYKPTISCHFDGWPKAAKQVRRREKKSLHHSSNLLLAKRRRADSNCSTSLINVIERRQSEPEPERCYANALASQSSSSLLLLSNANHRKQIVSQEFLVDRMSTSESRSNEVPMIRSAAPDEPAWSGQRVDGKKMKKNTISSNMNIESPKKSQSSQRLFLKANVNRSSSLFKSLSSKSSALRMKTMMQRPFLVCYSTILLLIISKLLLATNHGRSPTIIHCQEISSEQQELDREMSNLLTLTPPFAPTRRPLTMLASEQVRQSLLRAPSDGRPANSIQVEPSQPIQAGMASPSSHIASSSSEFVRTNELDAFLDDMNNNELRTVAEGRPIQDLFHAKPMAASSRPAGSMQYHNNNYNNNSMSAIQLGKSEQQSRQSTKPMGLLGSHSEQQIYSECALILQRTYVKNIDDPKHQLVPFGKTEQACISYRHIDKAIEQAKHKLKFREFAKMRKKPVPSGPGKPPLAPLDVIHSSLEPPEDLVAAVGEINMATTQIIADQFDLSNDELLNGLPLIDMSKTKFWQLCPLLVKQSELKCELGRFRTFTGHCNNLKHPTWGAAMTPFARYLPPVHPDGIWIPRKSIVSEITFKLDEGHRETHSNIHSPSIPAPVFNTHGPPLPPRPPPMPLQAGSHYLAGEPQRLGFALDPPPRPPPASFGASYEPEDFASEPSSSSLATSYRDEVGPDRDERLEQAGSVQFLRRAPPLEHDLHHLDEMPPPNSLATASSHHHHQQQHAPKSIAQELPSSRLVTSVVHRDMDLPSHDLSILFMSWGQLLDHDMTRAAQPPSSIKCCPQPDGTPASKHKLCLPIQVPEEDPFYGKFGVRCLEFRRTLAGVRPNCVLGPRVHQNAITSPIDANFVYGSSRAMAEGLRLFKGGRLRDRDWFRNEGLKPLLPGQEVEPDLECIARPRNLFCFLAGDVRANEQTHLTVLHTLYMREHNRLADRLSELNPHWDDERTYQETRHIVAASVQHVLINEYIPLLIGRKMTDLYNLTAQPAGADQRAYWHGYDGSVTTSVANSFAAAAFRQGHTFVQGSVERYNKFHEFVASEKLRHLFKQPFLLYQPGVLDELTSGMINQASQQYDPFLSEDISGHLFQAPELKFGHDLAAINLQRGREQGLPGYNLFREWCGLPRAETFEQLEPYLTNRTAYQYSRLYKHVDDIDLWSGGVSERKLPGAAIGPTFACIIARQFSNTRRGDRFWYENPGLPSSFTPDQLAELRKITLAKILCQNSDDLPSIQRWAFRLAHPVLNPRLDCNQLPEMDLQYWQEE